MNNGTKWEAVESSSLEYNDAGRVIHPSGDRFLGVVRPSYEGDKSIKLNNLMLPDLSVKAVVERGYHFERAVPERTLPEGLYIGLGENPVDTTLYKSDGDTVHTDSNDEWEWIEDPTLLPDFDTLVRLVPVTDVDELRERIEMAKRYIEARKSYYLDITDMKHILRHLDGEARNV